MPIQGYAFHREIRPGRRLADSPLAADLPWAQHAVRFPEIVVSRPFSCHYQPFDDTVNFITQHLP
jgi:hypothetical protein